MWNPTHVEITVSRAQNLKVKGKSGTNDAYVTIKLGKEKFQTTLRERLKDPEWHEQCQFPISEQNTVVKLKVFHRNLIGKLVGKDDFLGYAEIPLDFTQVYERPKSKWYALKNKPGHKGPDQYRGEIEVIVTYVVESISGSQMSLNTSGKFKKFPSLKGIGDKLSLKRSNKTNLAVSNTDLADVKHGFGKSSKTLPASYRNRKTISEVDDDDDEILSDRFELMKDETFTEKEVTRTPPEATKKSTKLLKFPVKIKNKSLLKMSLFSQSTLGLPTQKETLNDGGRMQKVTKKRAPEVPRETRSQVSSVSVSESESASDNVSTDTQASGDVVALDAHWAPAVGPTKALLESTRRRSNNDKEGRLMSDLDEEKTTTKNLDFSKATYQKESTATGMFDFDRKDEKSDAFLQDEIQNERTFTNHDEFMLNSRPTDGGGSPEKSELKLLETLFSNGNKSSEEKENEAFDANETKHEIKSDDWFALGGEPSSGAILKITSSEGTSSSNRRSSKGEGLELIHVKYEFEEEQVSSLEIKNNKAFNPVLESRECGDGGYVLPTIQDDVTEVKSSYVQPLLPPDGSRSPASEMPSLKGKTEKEFVISDNSVSQGTSSNNPNEKKTLETQVPSGSAPTLLLPEHILRQFSQHSRDDLIGLVLDQQKQLKAKETYIADLEIYIDNLLVKVLEAQPRILLGANEQSSTAAQTAKRNPTQPPSSSSSSFGTYVAFTKVTKATTPGDASHVTMVTAERGQSKDTKAHNIANPFKAFQSKIK